MGILSAETGLRVLVAHYMGCVNECPLLKEFVLIDTSFAEPLLLIVEVAVKAGHAWVHVRYGCKVLRLLLPLPILGFSKSLVNPVCQQCMQGWPILLSMIQQQTRLLDFNMQ